MARITVGAAKTTPKLVHDPSHAAVLHHQGVHQGLFHIQVALEFQHMFHGVRYRTLSFWVRVPRTAGPFLVLSQRN